MSRRPTLLDLVSGLLVRTYRLEAGIGDLGPFIIGNSGLSALYGEASVVHRVDSPGGARMLLRQQPGSVHACIYFPDALIQQLEAQPPQYGVHDGNVSAFATFVEEVDHLLLLAERARQRRPVSLFEMELQANVSKYLVVSRFLAGRNPTLSPAARLWLREHLFDSAEFDDPDPGVRQRYIDALRWAAKFIEAMRPLEPADRLATLRRFHESGPRNKLLLVDALAA